MSNYFQDIVQDVRYTFRTAAKSPGFTAAAILSLALGIGANSAIFSLVNSLLLRPLPIRAPEQMIEIYTSNPEGNSYAPSSYLDYLDIRKRHDLFTDAAAYLLAITRLSRGTETEVALCEVVSGNYFDVLGIRSERGRTFLPDEDTTPGARPVAVLSHGLWQGRFGADPGMIGKTIILNRIPYTVVGIAPPQFKGMIPGLSVDAWVPLMMLPYVRPEQPDDLKLRQNRGLFIKARLQPGVSATQAQAGLKVLESQLAQAYPETNRASHFTAMPSTQVHIHPRADRALIPVGGLLMGLVGLVLLIACTNVMSMLLARAEARRKEIAVRLALGSRPVRIVRQLLTESLLLALVGGGIGLLMAQWLVRLLGSFRPPLPFPLALDLVVDSRVVVFTFLLSLATGVVFGLTPALQASRPALVPALKDETVILGRQRRVTMRKVLVVAQVAVSLVLLIAAGLFVRSLVRAQSVDLGLAVDRCAVVGVDVGFQGYGTKQGEAFFRQLVERAGALPGVRSVSLTDRLPLDFGAQSTRVFMEGTTNPEWSREGYGIDFARVTPAYFRTLGVPLLSGRDFAWTDGTSAPMVAIVSESAARELWPGQEPIGKRLRRNSASAPPIEVIGVAHDTPVRSLNEGPRPFLYLPFEQSYESAMQLVARTDGRPEGLIPPLRGAVADLDRSLVLFTAKTLRQHLGLALFPMHMAAGLLGAFGLLGLVLASVGIYGLMSHYVAQRTREVGIRKALGARSQDVLRLVISEGMKVVAIGLALGLVLALAVGPLVAPFIVGVSASDPATLAGITVLLALVALVAIFIPGRRAARADPLAALTRM